jgi:hypothetical protein
MTRTLRTLSVLLLVAVLPVVGCSSGGDQAADTQENFGVRMARMNLWREALFRFRRAVEINPADAMAHNNLAVAYEANGDFDNALKSYREAIRLDKGNQYIQKNYSRFVEFTSRNRKREQRATASKAGETPPATTPTPVAASNAPTPDEPATPAAPPQQPAGTPPGSVTSPAPAGTAPAAVPPPPPPPQPKVSGDLS